MSDEGFEILWVLAWGVVALVTWLVGAPGWIPGAALVIGGLAVPVILFNLD